MAHDYYVVFEFTQKAGGFAGNRTFTGYANEAELLKMNTSIADGTEIVVDKGVTLTEAKKLTSLTPEICRISAAIEESCITDTGIISHIPLQMHIVNALFAIQDSRKTRERYHLTPISPFVFVEIGPEDTEKNQLLRLLNDEWKKPDGTIDDLDFLNLDLNVQVTKILKNRLNKYHNH